MRLIESDAFPFEFLSALAERESWRKEIHRPIYHVHKWWAKRLGSIFRGILLGATLSERDLRAAFYEKHDFEGVTVFDPFMGSGTTIGEAHKLGFTALGRDINPVATKSVEVAFGPLDKAKLEKALVQVLDDAGEKIRALYVAKDSKERNCEVLYHFWVMQAHCPQCSAVSDLFPSYVVASNAYPSRKPEVQVLCPQCGEVSRAPSRDRAAECPNCSNVFDPNIGVAKATKAICRSCQGEFSILSAVSGKRPTFRLYAKLVLTQDGTKEYLRATADDLTSYEQCSRILQQEVRRGAIRLPDLSLKDGHNTRQAISYGFRTWRDFFNDRQLLALGWLRDAIGRVEDEATREALTILFSGVLEFNNLFTSYKGEGTGAVRHMFAHHILKPERVPLEANVWGTAKSSGSFTGLFKTRLLRAIAYRQAPGEIHDRTNGPLFVSAAFTGRVEDHWPKHGAFRPRGIYISCGDSAKTELPDRSIDLVVTDPPFFDNVHYSELADFFYAWQRMEGNKSTRHAAEVQDADPARFGEKLRRVFSECHRILKEDGLLVFTYHHSRPEGWTALAQAILGAGFVVVNSQPVKAEMSVATPKAQAKAPIQLDIILVCRKTGTVKSAFATEQTVVEATRAKLDRLASAGLELSSNDRKVVLYGQLLCTLREARQIAEIEGLAARESDLLNIPAAKTLAAA